MNKKLYVVIGYAPKYDEQWICHDNNDQDVFDQKWIAETLCNFLQNAEANRQYTYRVAKLSFLD